MIPIHQWTHDGSEVLALKCVPASGITRNGFVWPLTVGAEVVAPDWSPEPMCGYGLHAWPWGTAIGDGKDPEWGEVWLVLGMCPDDVVYLGGKIKARRAVVRYAGPWGTAYAMIVPGQSAWTTQADASSATGYRGASSATGYRGASSATGDRGASSATGYRGASSATGDRGTSSTTGYRGASSATGDQGASSATGDQGASSATGRQGASSATGYRGASSATGYRGASSATGVCSCACVTGLGGRARGGPYSVIALARTHAGITRMTCAEIGIGDGSDGTLKAHTWYRVDSEGVFHVITDEGV